MTDRLGISAEARLRGLLSANRSIVGELSLPAVLRRIVETGRAISGARYAALGVIGPDGLLEQFVHSGMDPADVAQLGELPRGRGVLGALIVHPEPIRLSSIADDPRSAGFPPHHPPMRSFLGVPIRIRDAVYGNLYLTDRLDGDDFSDQDQELIEALAATAGIAIENARLYEQSRRRQEWLRASAEISRDLLAPNQDERDVLRRIAASVQRLADADVVAVMLPTHDLPAQLHIAVATGAGAAELIGSRYPTEGSMAWQAMEAGHGLQVGTSDGASSAPGHGGSAGQVGTATITASSDGDPLAVHLDSQVPVGPVMALPLTGEWRSRGAIVLGRTKDRPPFAASDLQMAEAFANQAALALELADSRADLQRLTVLEDRDRIARDLHDHVIQRLFASGLTVQSMASSVTDEQLRTRLVSTVTDLDETIRQIRTSIFALRENKLSVQSVRAAALAVVAEVAPVLPVDPAVQFVGPLDTLVDESVIADIEAVLREALTNVAKHARAKAVLVLIEVIAGRLNLVVLDDGVGLQPTRPHSGLANLEARAQQRGGDLRVDNRSEGGLRLEWTIPLGI